MSQQEITVALIGIGGYGNRYVSALLDAANERPDVRLVAAVDPNPSACMRLADLQAAKVPLYISMDALYADQRPNVVFISTPLHLHAIQTCLALSQGSHVLCEKPLCVTPEQGCEMIRARDRAQKVVAIGYQWSYSAAVQ